MVRTEPLPEGEYHINPNAVRITADGSVFDELKELWVENFSDRR